MNDLLQWIARNGGQALCLGIFLLILAAIAGGVIGDFFRLVQNSICAFTGKYPPPRPVVQCDCPDICNCCAQSECDEDCECWNNRSEE